MQPTDTGQDKVKKICEILTKETLEPAKQEADGLILKATQEAEEILLEAKRNAKRIEEDAKKRIEEKEQICAASLKLAAKQTLSMLKQEIEKGLFGPRVHAMLSDESRDPKVIAKFIEALVEGIKKEGLDGDLEAYIAKNVSVDLVNKELTKEVLDSLKEKSVKLGPQTGGAEVKVVDKNLILDLSHEALQSLLSRYVRDEFRETLFSV